MEVSLSIFIFNVSGLTFIWKWELMYFYGIIEDTTNLQVRQHHIIF